MILNIVSSIFPHSIVYIYSSPTKANTFDIKFIYNIAIKWVMKRIWFDDDGKVFLLNEREEKQESEKGFFVAALLFFIVPCSIKWNKKESPRVRKNEKNLLFMCQGSIIWREDLVFLRRELIPYPIWPTSRMA